MVLRREVGGPDETGYRGEAVGNKTRGKIDNVLCVGREIRRKLATGRVVHRIQRENSGCNEAGRLGLNKPGECTYGRNRRTGRRTPLRMGRLRPDGIIFS